MPRTRPPLTFYCALQRRADRSFPHFVCLLYLLSSLRFVDRSLYNSTAGRKHSRSQTTDIPITAHPPLTVQSSDIGDKMLPASTFNPMAQARSSLRNTVIEDLPQVSVRRAPPQKLPERPRIISPMSDDFPTPVWITVNPKY